MCAPARAGAAGRSVPVVAIGASAGGLEAIRAVLAKLPSAPGLALVVIQHLDPARKSVLRKLLSQATSLPVLEISNGMAVKPNHVYVVPSDKRVSIRKRILSLQSIANLDRYHPIDEFMVDLAAVQGDAAIGVVLSGMGSDGSRGLAAIKAANGITFAQDPKTAEWPAMPLNAIEATSVDFILSPARIGLELGHLDRHALTPKGREFTTQAFDHIFQILRANTGIDFRQYKRSTVGRRILRQMTLQKIRTLTQFARLLRSNREEAESLADRIFVPFTGFFRDAENLQSLRALIRSRLRSKWSEEPLRIWVAGCSTGEEVYSIAMILAEELGPKDSWRVHIFGTDIRERAIEQARAGVYSQAAVVNVSAARLKRFFTKSPGGYRISEELRTLCVFAQHDLTKDPPFSRLDLISWPQRSVLHEILIPGTGYGYVPLRAQTACYPLHGQFDRSQSVQSFYGERPQVRHLFAEARRTSDGWQYPRSSPAFWESNGRKHRRYRPGRKSIGPP